MGIRYKKRNRMEEIRQLPDAVLASLGTTDINFEKFDESLVWHDINRRLDKQQEKIDNG
jgi:hypothetical protein